MAAIGVMPGVAQSLTISPVIVELSPARRIVSVTLINTSESALSFQAQVLAWSQTDGVDHYDETTDLIVVPPIAGIAPGASQIFRVTMRTPPSPRERAFRLILEDVTEETAPVGDSATVSIRVRHSLPVFVASMGKTKSSARLGPCAAPAAMGCVRLENDGDRYLLVKSLSLTSGPWHKDIPAGTRVLAGAWREWTFTPPASLSGPLQVHADTSTGTFTGEVSIAMH